MRREQLRNIIFAVLGIGLISLLGWSIFWVIRTVWRQFLQLDATLAVGIITASTTVLVATLTVVLGRYFERKKEVAAHFRASKIEMYDAFLKEFFTVFGPGSDDPTAINLTPFLREWQRKMIVWGGSRVLTAYIKWKDHLVRGTPDATTLFLMEDFFREIRRDIGLSNSGLRKGLFFHFILKSPELFLAMARQNPGVTFEELVAREKELGIS